MADRVDSSTLDTPPSPRRDRSGRPFYDPDFHPQTGFERAGYPDLVSPGHSGAGAQQPPRRRKSVAQRIFKSRRRMLIALGAGTVAATGLGSGAVVLLGNESGTGGRGSSPKDAGAFSDRDASYVQGGAIDLGIEGVAETPAKAAEAAAKVAPKYPTPLSRDPVMHLLRRATFGPTAPDVAELRRIGIDAWLEQQLNPATVMDDATDIALAAYPLLGMSTAELKAIKDLGQNAMYQLGHATIARQVWSHRQLYEVMVDFWSNHLNITNPFGGGEETRTVSDREVIRKHALGKFSDMLLASAKDPAMLRYLDNASSDKRNVNENYGRELIELHTLGRDAGYTEVDVRQSAYIMTGRTVSNEGMFRYDARRHWTGKVKVLGFAHDNKSAAQGLTVGDAYVTYLAKHESTARNIARKLAVRFVADSPPKSLVDRLAKAYLDNGTAIVPVLQVLFRSLEFWIATGLKTRRPLENFVAAVRVLGIEPEARTPDAIREMYQQAQRLGNAPLTWGPPNGFPDVAGAWSSAHAMLGIWNSHRALAQGKYRGVRTPKPQYLIPPGPTTVGQYLDAMANRLVFQPLADRERKALLAYLGAQEATKIKDLTLGGKAQEVVPLILDSVYHALR